ncbi:hypothetical protein [Slackia isoflavoniconvertens]|uniref:hypothetical protein n=1 Tax=Slackia isoflavoniconvertens TaxID=572010 RepID=UPI003FD8705D
MTPQGELLLQDATGYALRVFAGVSKALCYTDDTSSDYYMNHVLGNVLDAEIRKMFEAFPEDWEEEIFTL